MNLFILADGRRTFYQWDTNRQLIVIEPICAEVHFDNGTQEFSLVREVKIDNGLRVVDVPDILLQSTKSITVFAYVCDGEGGYTRRSVVFPVMARPKPADYPFAGEDELRVWEEHEKKIEAAQNTANQGVQAAGAAAQAAQAADGKAQAAAAAAVAAQRTADGAIQAPAVAKVGQTIAVNAVDESGRPVSWRAVDFPSGGGSPGSGGIWSTVAEFTYNQNTELMVDRLDEESKHLHFTTEHGLAVGDVLLFPIDLDRPILAIRSTTNGYAEVTEVIDAQTVICANVLAVLTGSLPAKVEKSAGRVLFEYRDKITKPYARLRIEGATIHYGKLWTFSRYYSSYGPDCLLAETTDTVSFGFSIVQIVPGYGVGRTMISRVNADAAGNKHIGRLLETVFYTANYSPVPREHIMTPELVFNGLKIIVEEADTWEIP